MRQLSDKGKIAQTYEHAENFAKQGMRTLIVASKSLTAAEYEAFTMEYKQASLSLTYRKEKMENVMLKHEANFKVLGATGVEDKLQEGVGDTISALRSAGIKIWILTGDKTETAVNVANSISLLDSSVNLFNLTNHVDVTQCSQAIDHYLETIKLTLKGAEISPESNQFALVIDGKTLFIAMKHLRPTLCSLCLQCSAVVCARMSPIQKAEVVHMIKNSELKPVTAAIGDGANDVSMIQEADIGFGLIGKEGRQASNNSDLAFAKFCFLKRIILIHGHYYYIRVTNLIHYFFYKNSALVTPLFLYSFYTIFSAQTFFHDVLLMLFNMMSTSFPVLVYGLVEKNIPENLLDKEPKLYWLNHWNHNMDLSRCMVWFLTGIFHGFTCFTAFKYVYLGNEDEIDNKVGGLMIFGNMAYITMVSVVNAKLLLIARNSGWLLLLSVIFSMILLHFFYYFFTLKAWNLRFVDDLLYGCYLPIIKQSSFWFVYFITIVVSFLPDIVYRLYSDVKATRLRYSLRYKKMPIRRPVSLMKKLKEFKF